VHVCVCWRLQVGERADILLTGSLTVQPRSSSKCHVSRYIWVSACDAICVCLGVCVSACVWVSVCLRVSVCLCVCVSRYLCVSESLCVSVFARQHTLLTTPPLTLMPRLTLTCAALRVPVPGSLA
jgi:hypothetical protein